MLLSLRTAKLSLAFAAITMPSMLMPQSSISGSINGTVTDNTAS